MARHRWRPPRKPEPDDPLLRGRRIACEECGTVYDQQDGDGLCRYCNGEAFELVEREVKPPD